MCALCTHLSKADFLLPMNHDSVKSEFARRREVRLRLDAKKELDYDDETDQNKPRQSSKWKSVHKDLAETRFLVAHLALRVSGTV